ncbi:hypothetical protein COT48_00185 [Candidatus Woesearchaeota archaeon CG08_land_8_20_14_0_20_47_9]|nr:MAG: hypothetical protein COT48_00185 [Candidatus Woesearchaeota archaeon CG08_land_8_20_14_0_20_47_9]
MNLSLRALTAQRNWAVKALRCHPAILMRKTLNTDRVMKPSVFKVFQPIVFYLFCFKPRAYVI